jgi:hypothetical protein
VRLLVKRSGRALAGGRACFWDDASGQQQQQQQQQKSSAGWPVTAQALGVVACWGAHGESGVVAGAEASRVGGRVCGENPELLAWGNWKLRGQEGRSDAGRSVDMGGSRQQACRRP